MSRHEHAMTVRELIAKLCLMPLGAPVVITNKNGSGFIENITICNYYPNIWGHAPFEAVWIEGDIESR